MSTTEIRYRALTSPECIHPGDEYLDPNLKVWNPHKSQIGKPYDTSSHMDSRRPLATEDTIPTCGRGHKFYPLKLWDCPDCHQLTRDKLAAMTEDRDEWKDAAQSGLLGTINERDEAQAIVHRLSGQCDQITQELDRVANQSAEWKKLAQLNADTAADAIKERDVWKTTAERLELQWKNSRAVDDRNQEGFDPGLVEISVALGLGSEPATAQFIADRAAMFLRSNATIEQEVEELRKQHRTYLEESITHGRIFSVTLKSSHLAMSALQLIQNSFKLPKRARRLIKHTFAEISELKSGI